MNILFGTLCICIFQLFGANGDSDEDHGLKMIARAFKSVCWYEHLKQSGKLNQNDWLECTPKSDQIVNHFLKADQLKNNPSLKVSAFVQSAEPYLPNKVVIHGDYKACYKYLKDNKASPPSDESDALKDEKKDKNYPFKALAYCLIGVMKKRHGSKSIDAVKAEVTHSKKDWKQTLLDRENEFRSWHDSPPLQMDDSLAKGAQEWADSQAKKCAQGHMKTDGSGAVGENLFSTNHLGIDWSEASYMAADSFYNEISLYDWKKDSPSNIKAVGHFTQQVWKSTKKVGYGHAKNERCSSSGPQLFVVARYSPSGNNVFPGMFKKNVLPRKN